MNLYFKIALIWFGGYLLAVFAVFVTILALYFVTYYHKPKLPQYSEEDGRTGKLIESAENYMLKPGFINRILSVVCWPVTIAFLIVWILKEYIPVLKACPEGEIEDEPEMTIEATWDLKDDDE